jgi:malic enzyme
MGMKLRAAEAIADCLVGPPRRDYIIPDSLDKDVALKISEALTPHKK